MIMIKLYIGGSPCTHWSIAQTKSRETEPSGLGWELFKNYVIGLKKYKPDYFLYENNKSMSQAIKEQITKELGVEPILINSALVSAQNRNRLYWTNIPGVVQPEDRGILLRDILETGVAWKEKSYTLDADYYKTGGTYNPERQHSNSRHMAAEPVNITKDGKAQCLRATYYKDGIRNMVGNDIDKKTCVAEPVGITKNGKAYALTATYCKEPTIKNTLERNQRSMVAVPCAARQVGRRIGEDGKRHDYDENIEHFQRIEINENPDKTNTLTTVQKDNMVIEGWNGKSCPFYAVRNGFIFIKDKQYPIKLPDGYYVIRKLTVEECMRLQTVPDTYFFPVSNSQAYKMLGNGWTVEVISHILSFIPKISTEDINVMSMYDGMSCGRIALDKLNATVSKYYATEIDKYAIKTSKENYPEIIHLGDAYQVREADWQVS